MQTLVAIGLRPETEGIAPTAIRRPVDMTALARLRPRVDAAVRTVAVDADEK